MSISVFLSNNDFVLIQTIILTTFTTDLRNIVISLLWRRQITYSKKKILVLVSDNLHMCVNQQFLVRVPFLGQYVL